MYIVIDLACRIRGVVVPTPILAAAKVLVFRNLILIGGVSWPNVFPDRRKRNASWWRVKFDINEGAHQKESPRQSYCKNGEEWEAG